MRLYLVYHLLGGIKMRGGIKMANFFKDGGL